jgi:sucrose phosphorylase
LLAFRNTSEAFDLEGSIEIQTPSESEIIIHRKNQDTTVAAVLTANLKTKEFSIYENGNQVLSQ